jgi:hypothetical protein
MIRHLKFVAICFITVFTAEAASIKQQENAKQPAVNISARFHPDKTEFNAFADLIFWTAKEVGADCWSEIITETTTPDQTYLTNNMQQVNFGFDFGLKIGMGYGMLHDQWDTKIYYTWFNTTGRDSVSNGPGSVYSTFLGNFYLDNTHSKGIASVSYEAASISWKISFNMFDWELGRNFWVSKSLALRPFIGIKGGWIHQYIYSIWQHPTLKPDKPTFNVGTEDIKNNFWGIGPQGGLNTKWMFFSANTNFFSIFGDISGAIMWGHWTFGDTFKNDADQQITIHLRPMNTGATMMRLFTGLEWEGNFKENRYQFSTKLGYEAQFWLDQLQFYSFTGGHLDNALTLQGGTLEFCFDF